MELQIENGGVITDPDEKTTEEALRTLDGKSNSFAILDHPDKSFIKASGGPDAFVLEYRDNGTFHHYRSKNEALTLRGVTLIFRAYRRGARLQSGRDRSLWNTAWIDVTEELNIERAIERLRRFSPFVKDTDSEIVLRPRGLGGWLHELDSWSLSFNRKIIFSKPSGYINMTWRLIGLLKRTVRISRGQARRVFVDSEHQGSSYDLGVVLEGVTVYRVKARARSGKRSRQLTIYNAGSDNEIAHYLARRIREFGEQQGI